MSSIRALVVREAQDQPSITIEELDPATLAERPLKVRVAYSTLNYKDGMVMRGLGRLVRSYPHIPGVDLVGEVIEDASMTFQPGEWIIATGYRIGELYWGGYAQQATLDPAWAVRLPPALTPRHSMAIGTAGLSAMLAIMALEHMGVQPVNDAPLLVTGAAGGVGSIAVAIASRLGYQVAGSTGRMSESDYLTRLGATTIVPRSDLETGPERPLESEHWLGCIDSVGGPTLARVLAQTRSRGAIASVGLAGGAQFSASVMPFLLRGVSILGIDSVNAPQTTRTRAWERLSELLDRDLLDQLTTEITLDDLPGYADRILSGQVRGRVVVNLHPGL
ncbi:MAG: MDR family oxidoreductase [Ferrimicrobium sp.]|jgi:acrylyl-CoA reductase (NADPH)|uniref:MDR family oxidoreductase n=1 Tax=Ferrimicrobium acidiphilum TaxID=121039 RepID=A0ABV3Y175_9ACTN|nr:MDR family oxidoreductase [Ferrimicrobium sp.]